MNQQHTPTPWKVTGRYLHSGDGSETIAVMSFPKLAANAAHIVKCVNSYDALVKALVKVQEEAESGFGSEDSRSWSVAIEEIATVARAALSAAGETP